MKMLETSGERETENPQRNLIVILIHCDDGNFVLANELELVETEYEKVPDTILPCNGQILNMKKDSGELWTGHVVDSDYNCKLKCVLCIYVTFMNCKIQY
jgi:hypothetical protein